MRMVRYSVFFLTLTVLAACAKDSNQQKKEVAQKGDPVKGRGIYLANCAVCHNSDPAKDGPLGPAIKGSSRPLLEARVLSANYPPGYKPKRNTSAMPPMPYLKSEIPNLEAFLR